MTYTVLVYEVAEDEGGGYWANVAELPGCFTTGKTIDEIEVNIRDAIETHLTALKATGQPVPAPAALKIEVAVPA